MHHHVRQLSVSIVRTVESDICRCISPRGFRSIQRTITGLGGVGPAPCVGERVELRLAHLPARFAKQDIVIGVRVKRRIEIQDRHSHWEIPSDRKASEDCHRNKGDYFRRTARDFSTSVEMTRLHRNYKRMQQLAVSVSGMGQLTQPDTDDCYNLMKVRSASRLPESVDDRGDLRSPGRA